MLLSTYRSALSSVWKRIPYTRADCPRASIRVFKCNAAAKGWQRRKHGSHMKPFACLIDEILHLNCSNECISNNILANNTPCNLRVCFSLLLISLVKAEGSVKSDLCPLKIQ